MLHFLIYDLLSSVSFSVKYFPKKLIMILTIQDLYDYDDKIDQGCNRPLGMTI